LSTFCLHFDDMSTLVHTVFGDKSLISLGGCLTCEELVGVTHWRWWK